MLLRQVEDGPVGKDAASALAKRVVEALSLPFFVSQEPARIGASAGIPVTELASDAVAARRHCSGRPRALRRQARRWRPLGNGPATRALRWIRRFESRIRSN